MPCILMVSMHYGDRHALATLPGCGLGLAIAGTYCSIAIMLKLNSAPQKVLGGLAR